MMVSIENKNSSEIWECFKSMKFAFTFIKYVRDLFNFIYSNLLSLLN